MPHFISKCNNSINLLLTTNYLYKYSFNIPIIGLKKINNNNCNIITTNNNNINLYINNNFFTKNKIIKYNDYSKYYLYEAIVKDNKYSKNNLIWVPLNDFKYSNNFIRDIYNNKYYYNNSTKLIINDYINIKFL